MGAKVQKIAHHSHNYPKKFGSLEKCAYFCNLSVLSVYRFENGTVTNISLSTFLLLMKAVGCINDLNDLMPEQPESLYLYNKKNKKVQRVRHKKV
jgi:hypothetical protein